MKRIANHSCTKLLKCLSCLAMCLIICLSLLLCSIVFLHLIKLEGFDFNPLKFLTLICLLKDK